MDEGLSQDVKKATIAAVLSSLGLTKSQHTLIGGKVGMVNGLSG